MKKIKLGKYKHYKGHIYEVLGKVLDSETLAELVLYKALYSSKEYQENTLWVRPLNMFFEKVIVNGQKVPRFTYIG